MDCEESTSVYVFVCKRERERKRKRGIVYWRNNSQMNPVVAVVGFGGRMALIIGSTGWWTGRWRFAPCQSKWPTTLNYKTGYCRLVHFCTRPAQLEMKSGEWRMRRENLFSMFSVIRDCCQLPWFIRLSGAQRGKETGGHSKWHFQWKGFKGFVFAFFSCRSAASFFFPSSY